MLQHGAYNLLIDACYDRESFPTFDQAIEWTWCSDQTEIEALKFILNRFFYLDGDQYVQSRIKEEIDEYHKKCETNNENGKSGGRPKKTKPVLKITQSVNLETDSQPTRNPVNTDSKPLLDKQYPVSSSQDTETKKQEEFKSKPLSASSIPPLSAGFQEFWNEWPAGERKVGKVKANQFWKREKLEARTDEIVALVAAWKLTEKWTGGFCPQPMTWLNGRHYEDGPPQFDMPVRAKPQTFMQQRSAELAALGERVRSEQGGNNLNVIDMGMIEHGPNV